MITRFDHSWEIDYLLPEMIDGLPIYEFGVCTGNTLRRALDVFKENNKPFGEVYGFDSWEGLPNTIDKEWFAFDWQPGSFSALKEYNVSSVEELLPLLREKINHDVKFISGWYKDTLNEETAKRYNMSQAMYINIDVDIYSSTKEVLDFCFDNGIICEGTIIRYDDWMSCGSNEGNQKAHHETIEERGAIFKRFSFNVFQFKGFSVRI